jgi:uncharacterized protein (DUF4213/DUF364 family)
MVRSGRGLGLAMTLVKSPEDETRPRILSPNLAGMALQELAQAAKSWNFGEASLGIAAINAWYNSPDQDTVKKCLQKPDMNAFDAWKERARGKKVTVIGHFPHLERTLAPLCELSILEKRPQKGDYPDSACEFLLPCQDFVFATGVTLINKTLPRLLELSRHCGLILVGPSVPLAPVLFGFGILDLQGFAVRDPELCAAVVRGENNTAGIFDAGKRVGLGKE